MVEAFQDLIDAGKKHGVHTGLHIRNTERLKEWMEKGMSFIGYNTDLGLIKTAAASGLKDLRAHAAKLGRN